MKQAVNPLKINKSWKKEDKERRQELQKEENRELWDKEDKIWNVEQKLLGEKWMIGLLSSIL